MPFTFIAHTIQFPVIIGNGNICGGNMDKQRQLANISKFYGDGDLELSDSDENDDTSVAEEKKQDVSYISKSSADVEPG